MIQNVSIYFFYKDLISKYFNLNSMDSAQLRANDINNDVKRKSDVVNLIHEFLLRNNMAKTAQILKKQAIIADKQNIEEYIEAIKMSSTLHEQDKQHKIKTELEKRYIKEISKGDYESALNILNQKMPEYFSEQDLQKFAESLIPSSEMTKTLQKNDCLLLSMFEAYFIKNPFEEAKLPNVRAKIFSSSKQIWYIKYSGQYIVAIDQDRKAMTFSKNFDLLYQKDNIHDKMVSNLSWRNQFEFATCSESGEIKIWNYKLEQLYLFKYHKGMINCISFFTFEDKHFLVSGGHDKYFVLNDITNLENHKITKIKLKQLIARDIKFYKKRNLLIFLNEKKKEVSTLKFYSPSSMKWIGQIKLSELFFEMEISQTDEVLHIISRSGEIINYSLKTHEKIGVFIGTNAKNFAIRIQKGGFMNQFLATGSESGEILFYNERKVQPIKRLKTIEKTVVNCVSWIDFSTIVCGCDNGKIQFWTYEKDARQ